PSRTGISCTSPSAGDTRLSPGGTTRSGSREKKSRKSPGASPDSTQRATSSLGQRLFGGRNGLINGDGSGKNIAHCASAERLNTTMATCNRRIFFIEFV